MVRMKSDHETQFDVPNVVTEYCIKRELNEVSVFN